MAHLTEKRSRIPLVATAPVDGSDDSIRGQIRMLETAGDLDIYVCTTGDETGTSTLTVQGLIYTSVADGDAGEEVSIEYVVGGIAAPAITVVDKAITVTATVAATGITISDAIEASISASALVTVSAGDSTILAAAAVAFLAGGAGTRAAGTFNTSLVVTANESGVAGNKIAIVIESVTGKPYVSATVSYDQDTQVNTITIDGDSAVHTTADMAATMTTNSNVNKFVSAVGSTDTLVAAASVPLTGGATLSVWSTLTLS